MSDLPSCCCEGVGVDTPQSVANPPGLPALRYRAGTHATFLSTMLARLSASDFPGLIGLTTREVDDPSIALLDAWATVADVLTFYQERIANEGYLRTATELRSVLELARLIGYEPRPGVAASTFLAFGLEKGHIEEIPTGTRAQSLPGPGELPQPYETSEPLAAREVFNDLKVRSSRPQAITRRNARTLRELWLAGTATRLRPNDGLLIQVGDQDVDPALRLVASVEEDVDAGRTKVVLQGKERATPDPPRWRDLSALIDLVVNGRPASPAQDVKPPKGAAGSDTALRLAQVFYPGLADVLYAAWANANATKPQKVQVYAMRVKASLFGANSPKQIKIDKKGVPRPIGEWEDWPPQENAGRIDLDNPYPDVKSGTLVAVVPPPTKASLSTLAAPAAALDATILGVKAPTTVEQVNRADYGIAAKTTRIRLGDKDPWKPPGGQSLSKLRQTVVFTQSEELELAEAPIANDVCRTTLELDGLYEGLEPGRQLIVSGERADLPGVDGVPSAELVTIAEVRQGPIGEDGNLRPGEKNHTYLVLESPGLQRCYERSTLKVYGNVVHATHGESRAEVLGSGDATVAHQRFTLRSSPLTYVSAPTANGVQSTLKVTVDGIRWPARPSFLGLGPRDRGYLTRADDQRVSSVVFPNGREGRRLPTGPENVRARYRSGIGQPGNIDGGRITLLATKPLGVRDVVNPLPATGGADPESADQARGHAPLPLRSLDRLVSVTDYADFARVFAGVGQATADRLGDGRGQLIVVSVAGDGGALLTQDSDVVKNLRRALRRFGDGSVRVSVLVAERLVLRLSAAIRLLPDYKWDTVGPAVRAALLDTFSFDRRQLGQDVALSHVLATIQAVAGVHSATVDPGSFAFEPPPPAPRSPVFHPAPRLVAPGARREAGVLHAAQHLYLTPELPELLVLTKVTA